MARKKRWVPQSKKLKTRWTERDKAFLKENAGKMRDEDIAKKLKRTTKSVRCMRERMEIRKAGGRGITKLKGD
jgi:hypothetical protein